MQITTPPGRPPQIKIGPLSPAVAGPLGRFVQTPSLPVAFVTPGQLRLRAGLANGVNVAGLGAMWTPKPENPILHSLGQPFEDLQRQCLAAKLIGAGTPVTATSLMLIGNGKSIEKLFDPKATPLQKVTGVTGVANATAGWAHEMAPAAQWLTPYTTTFKVVDLAANGVSLAAELRNPNRNVAKCIFTGIKLSLGVASLALAQFPQLASVKTGIDSVSIVWKIGDNFIVAALENALAPQPCMGVLSRRPA